MHCTHVSNGTKYRFDQKSHYQSNIERLLLINPEGCKQEKQRLILVKRWVKVLRIRMKVLSFHKTSDSIHQLQIIHS